MTKQTRYSYNRHKSSPFQALFNSEIILLPRKFIIYQTNKQKSGFFLTLIAHQDIFWSYFISAQILYLIISCIALKCNDVTQASNFGTNSTLQTYLLFPVPPWAKFRSLTSVLHWVEFHLQWVSVCRFIKNFKVTEGKAKAAPSLN